ncbi:hypothetical protein D3C87_1636150 [compost metagenome]
MFKRNRLVCVHENDRVSLINHALERSGQNHVHMSRRAIALIIIVVRCVFATAIFVVDGLKQVVYRAPDARVYKYVQAAFFLEFQRDLNRLVYVFGRVGKEYVSFHGRKKRVQNE